VEKRLETSPWRDHISIAVVNSPTSTVISGNSAAVHDFVANTQADSVRAHLLPVDYASHSSQVESLREPLVSALAQVSSRVPDVPMYSTVTRDRIDGSGLDGDYWYRNLREPVRFHDVIQALESSGHDVFIEVSGHPVLTPHIDGDSTAVGTLQKDQPGLETLLSNATKIFVHGIFIDWAKLLPSQEPDPAAATGLPPYPFQHQSFWLADPISDKAQLHRIDWVPIARPARQSVEDWAVIGNDLPRAVRYREWPAAIAGGHDVVVSFVAPHGNTDDVPVATRQYVHEALTLLREWLADSRTESCRLVFVTRGALSDLASATVWGLLHTAQTEHPDRFQLVDLDDAESAVSLPDAIRCAQPQVAIRSGQMVVPQLVPADTRQGEQVHTDGTILITGGTGMMGATLARHLAKSGAQRLLLVSRQGQHAEGAPQLLDDLRAAGATAAVESCDVSDPDQLSDLLRNVQPPLTGVIHAAGQLDDGVVTRLTDEQVDTVFRPKVDAAWNLHLATRQMDLSFFILCSSVAGIIGTAGQAGYAAANAFLDALAQHRRDLGLPAQSMAWGLWQQPSAMTQGMTPADYQRLVDSGVVPFSDAVGVSLFDRARLLPEPLLVAASIDHEKLRRRSDSVPGKMPGRALIEALRESSTVERAETVLGLIRKHAAAVLGGSAEEIDPGRAFRELGYDSLTSLQLRNRLNKTFGVRLPATAVFDHPTSPEMATAILDQLFPAERPAPDLILRRLSELESLLDTLALDGQSGAAIANGIRQLQQKWESKAGKPKQHSDTVRRIDTATESEILAFIDNELGRAADVNKTPVSGE
ncbi:SDR family NAD(P)-dependent oxidoreductase, partial [Streptomyces sp. NPDC094472]|uniref:SDR family NAD(P)-dependent oxidoreductase n=1 Tax=unclassified Streptomyces TaxID=2593676 RepID=UPI00331C7541